jgi:rRNA maturation endonuclease Nob1
MSTLIKALIIITTIIILVLIIIKILKNKLRRYSGYIPVLKSIFEGLKYSQQEENNQPLSVGGGDPIYLPMILKDFPDFHPATMSEKVKRFMFEYYECLEKKDINILHSDSITNTVKETVRSQILDLEDKKTVRYDNIKVHAVAISAYSKTIELATVRYQAALEYVNEAKKKIQVKYSVDMTYTFKDTDSELFSLNCQNCGAPLDTAHTKCMYCGTEIVRNIDKVWRISDFRKLKQVS